MLDLQIKLTLRILMTFLVSRIRKQSWATIEKCSKWVWIWAWFFASGIQSWLVLSTLIKIWTFSSHSHVSGSLFLEQLLDQNLIFFLNFLDIIQQVQVTILIWDSIIFFRISSRIRWGSLMLIWIGKKSRSWQERFVLLQSFWWS